MKRKMTRAGRRLRGRGGESIAETLIALAIITAGLTMLASMFTASFKMIKLGEDAFKNYIVENNKRAGIVTPSATTEPENPDDNPAEGTDGGSSPLNVVMKIIDTSEGDPHGARSYSNTFTAQVSADGTILYVEPDEDEGDVDVEGAGG